MPGRSARSAALVAALALGTQAGCYVSYSSCDVYYGYYDYYCDYYWYDYWWYYDYDWYYYRTIPPESYPNPDPEVAGRSPDATTRVTEVLLLEPGPPAERPTHLGDQFGEAYPCGRGDHGYTICDEGSGAIDPEEEHLLLAMRLSGDFDFEPGSNDVVVGWAFDSDNDPSNNFHSSNDLANEYFGDTDRWYAATWEPATGWNLVVTDWNDGNPVSEGTNGRVVFERDLVVLVVPLDDFVAQDPGVRMSIFRQGIESDDWSGFVHPLPSDGLIRPIGR